MLKKLGAFFSRKKTVEPEFPIKVEIKKPQVKKATTRSVKKTISDVEKSVAKKVTKKMTDKK